MTETGKPQRVHADQLEIAPDGRYLYFQPSSGPLARVEATLLTDTSVGPATLAAAIEIFFDSRATGGTAIDADGNIYMSDTDQRRIPKVSPGGSHGVLIEDPPLVWSDAMWDRPRRIALDTGDPTEPSARFRRWHTLSTIPSGSIGCRSAVVRRLLPSLNQT